MKTLDGETMQKTLNTITGREGGLSKGETLPSATEFANTLLEKGPIKLSPEYQEIFLKFAKMVADEQKERDKEDDIKLAGLFDKYRVDKDHFPMNLIQIRYAFPNNHKAWVHYQNGNWDFGADTGENCGNINLDDVNRRLEDVMNLP